MRQEIEKRIRKNKPNIADSSVRTYTSIIYNLCSKMNNADPKVFSTSPVKVLDFLKEVEPRIRKTTLAALVVYLGDGDDGKNTSALEKYRHQMMDDIAVYTDHQKKQQRSEKEQENWMEWADVVKLYKQYFKEYSKLLKKKEWNKYERSRVNDLLLLAVYTLIPPRRSEDYCLFKLHNVDKEKDNYMEGKTFVFNTYKTAKKYGRQVVKIPSSLFQIVSLVMNREDWGEYLLRDTRGNKLTPSKLTIALNKIFGKNVSSSMLRKSYLSNKYKNIPLLKDIEETSASMGNSFNVALQSYVKPSAKKDDTTTAIPPSEEK
jgi:hypothetical protein